MSNQLVKKNPTEGYQNVFPKTFIDAIKDKESGVSLQEILQGFNMYFLSYNGSRALTRCKVPSVLRKEGLWITYVLYDHTVVTEWYNSDQIDDNSWSMDSNWRVASNFLVGDVSVSADGYWVINGEKTEAKAQGEQGVTPLLRVGANNKLQVSYNAGKAWKDISDYIVPRFKWNQGVGTTAGTIQISMDLGKTWTNLSNEITNNLRISRYIGINESLPTSGVAEGTIYMKGPYYDEGDTSHANPIYRMWVYAWKGNTLAWQDNGEFTTISAGVVQERGTSTTEVMSQDAVTRELTKLEDEVNQLGQNLDLKVFPQVYINRKNLFNKDAGTQNAYIDSHGVIKESTSFQISEIIPVDENSTYFLSNSRGNAVGNENSFGWFYKADGSRELFNTGTTTIQTPEDCVGLCFSYIKSYIDSVQLEKGNGRTSYEPFVSGDFSSLFADSIANIEDSFANPLNEFLYSPKSLNLCGGYNCIMGVYVNDSGEFVSNTNYKTYIIPVGGLTKYQLYSSDFFIDLNVICVFKDRDGQFISFTSNVASVTSPENAKWLFVSFPEERLCQVTVGENPIAYRSGDLFINPKIAYDYDAILPRQIFIIGGEQNSVYHSEYCRAYNEQNVYADKNGGKWAFNKRCWRIEATDSVASGDLLSFNMRDRRSDEIINTFSIPTRVGSKSKTSTNKKILTIGDSFCYGGHYLKQMADMCGNTTFVGMRTAQRYGLKCEGRGGWTLAQYFNPKSTDISLSHIQPFSPFMHADGYNYYGVVEFWAAIVNGTSQYPYGSAGFEDYVSWFDTTGHKANPDVNDLMYNTTSGYYEYWNGSAWTSLANEPTFVFNFAKYVSIWQISAPDFVVIQLGTNDFFYGNADFEQWFDRMDSVIASINGYGTSIGKTINILLCTVLTMSGTPNNTYNDGIIRRNRGYYFARKCVIEKYDPSINQVNNHVYVVDTGVVVDDKFGFLTEERLPFAYYEGDARELFDINGVHPDVGGYKQFGNPIAGAIQYLR